MKIKMKSFYKKEFDFFMNFSLQKIHSTDFKSCLF